MANFDEVAKVWEGSYFNYPLPLDTFVGEIVVQKLKETPNRVVQINHDTNYEMTCDELRVSSVRVAQNLTKLGLKADDVVGVVCRHSDQVSYLLVGCILIGVPINPLDLSFDVKEIIHLFGLTQPKLVVCDLEVLGRVREALMELNNDAKVIVIDHEGVADTFHEILAPTGTENDFVALKFEKNAEDKILSIVGSSGTTGPSKGVLVSHAWYLSYLLRVRNGKPSMSLTLSPLFSGSTFLLNLCLAFAQSDVRVISRESFSVEKISEIVNNRAITHLTLNPVNLQLLLQSDFPELVDHSSIAKITCVGTIITENVRQKFDAVFPEKELLVAYGTTETGYISITVPGEHKAPFSVGSMIFTRMKVVDDDHQKLGVGEVGDICLMPHVKFLGYQNNPVATKNALDDEGFYKTGDVGYFDAKGCLFVLDRKTAVIKCKSYQIYASEIESLIETIEGVESVTVVGIPDENLPAAVVVKRKGFEHLSEQFIKDFVAEKLPFHMHLDAGVYFVEKLPFTPSGKVKKNVVVDIVKNLLLH